MQPMMYQMVTYMAWYFRLATVMKMLMPNMIQATTTRMSRYQGSSAYSQPWFRPASRVTTAPRMITFHRAAVARPSFSLQSLTPQRRGIT